MTMELDNSDQILQSAMDDDPSHPLNRFPFNASVIYEDIVPADVPIEDLELGVATCMVCASRAGARAGTRLLPCRRCDGVVYCSKHHMKLDAECHDRVCDALALVAEDWASSDRFTFGELGKLIGKLRAEQQLAADGAPAACESWDSAIFRMPCLRRAEIDSWHVVGRQLTSLLCWPLTVAWTIEQLGLGADADGRELTLHLVGASDEQELAMPSVWLMLDQFLPPGVRCHLVCIGPELEARELQLSENLRITCHMATYDKYLSSVTFASPVPIWTGKQSERGATKKKQKRGSDESATTPMPSAVFFFQPGFSVQDYDWAPSLQVMGRKLAEVPLVLTTNSLEEVAVDEDLLLAHGIVLEGVPQPCPFASHQVIQSGTLANDVYVKNAVISFFSAEPGPLDAAPESASASSAMVDDDTAAGELAADGEQHIKGKGKGKGKGKKRRVA